MRRESILSGILPVLGAVVILILGYSFERWTAAMRATVSREFRGVWKLAWLLSLSKLVVAGLLLGLWRVVNLSGGGIVVGLALLIIGLFPVFGPQLTFGLNLRLPMLLALPDGRTVSWAGAFIAAMGLFRLIHSVRTSSRPS